MSSTDQLRIAAAEKPRMPKVELHMDYSGLSWKYEIRPTTNHKSSRLRSGDSEHVPMLIIQKRRKLSKESHLQYNFYFRIASAYNFKLICDAMEQMSVDVCCHDVASTK